MLQKITASELKITQLEVSDAASRFHNDGPRDGAYRAAPAARAARCRGAQEPVDRTDPRALRGEVKSLAESERCLQSKQRKAEEEAANAAARESLERAQAEPIPDPAKKIAHIEKLKAQLQYMDRHDKLQIRRSAEAEEKERATAEVRWRALVEAGPGKAVRSLHARSPSRRARRRPNSRLMKRRSARSRRRARGRGGREKGKPRRGQGARRRQDEAEEAAAKLPAERDARAKDKREAKARARVRGGWRRRRSRRSEAKEDAARQAELDACPGPRRRRSAKPARRSRAALAGAA